MNTLNYRNIEAKKSDELDICEDHYIVTDKNESCRLGYGTTKEEALADTLYNIRCESEDALEYDETRANLIEVLEKSEKFVDAYNDWTHFKFIKVDTF